MSSSFWEQAARSPDRVAVVEPSGATLRAGELLAAAHRLAHALQARGLLPGAVVAFCLPNRAALLEVYLAAMQLGLHLAPLHTKLRESEVAHVLRDAAASMVFCDASTEEVVRGAALTAGLSPEACISVDDAAYASMKHARPAIPPPDRRLGALLLYTSGTTGRPKGVKRPLRPGAPEATLASEYYLRLFGLRPGDGVHLVCSPLHHGAALNWCTDHLHLGHTVVLTDKWTPERMLALVEPRSGVEATPALEAELIAHARACIAAFKCPRAIEFVASVPRDENGKLRRRELRDAAWAGRERAI